MCAGSSWSNRTCDGWGRMGYNPLSITKAVAWCRLLLDEVARPQFYLTCTSLARPFTFSWTLGLDLRAQGAVALSLVDFATAPLPPPALAGDGAASEALLCARQMVSAAIEALRVWHDYLTTRHPEMVCAARDTTCLTTANTHTPAFPLLLIAFPTHQQALYARCHAYRVWCFSVVRCAPLLADAVAVGAPPHVATHGCCQGAQGCSSTMMAELYPPNLALSTDASSQCCASL